MRVGFTASSFDLLHAGHISMLQEAKGVCDYLICGLQTDPTIDRPEKNKPIQNVSERHIQLDAVKYVDEIIPYTTEEELCQLIALIHPDVRIIGEEYEPKDFTAKEYCIEQGIEIYYNSRHHRFASSQLRNKMKVSDE